MLQSTTYYGFGEENVTAMAAIQIVVDDDYPARSRWIEEYLSAGLQALREKYPEDIAEIRGAGALWGLRLTAPAIGKAAGAAARMAPRTIREDAHFVDKLVAGAVVDEAYREHGVMLFLGSNQDTLLKMSLPLIAGKAECDQLLECIDACLAKGLGTLLTKFVKNNLPLASS
jgi:putrescine aminotransferase